MTRRRLSRRALLVLGAGGAIGITTLGPLNPVRVQDAEAQDDPSQLPVEDPALQTEPATGETDPLHVDAGLAEDAPLADPAFAGTPVPEPAMAAPDLLPPPPTWEPTEAGMATSLGGSDIAVASTGGSYQVDAPRRKSKKNRGGKKRR